MENLITYVLFAVGLYVLVKGADFLVSSASTIARRFGLPELIIGLTIVAFGTSLPEMFVSGMAAVRGNTDLAIGNVLGSNIANILLILGLAATICPIQVTRQTTWKEIPLSLLAAVVLGILANDVLLADSSANILSRGDGLVLLCFVGIFLAYILSVAKNGNGNAPAPASLEPAWRTGAKLLGGLVMLSLGGQWIVDGALALGALFGASESLMGLTVVAVGTSLPELATSVVAAHRGNADIAVGNVVGSNIINIFWILGATSLLQPLPFHAGLNADVQVCLAATVLLFTFMFTGTRYRLNRLHGLALLATYTAYTTYLILRG